MLFNAPEFLVGFLPVVLAGFFLIGARARPLWAILWLVVASLFFYGWWRPEFVFLILGSATVNYLIGLRLGMRPDRSLLTFGIAANLATLGWFKYSGFLAELANDLADSGLPVPDVVLPLGISFYTFQQIAYLVDANAGIAREKSFARYLLFVTFFPQLIAGPIVHHREMLSQFHRPETYRPRLANLLLGLGAFSIGLFKKVFIADPLGPQAALAFGPAADGIVPVFADAWFGSLAYTLQLYFDFSGYSDMAVGLGLMFGIRLPFNFMSPFKSASIIEFWRRWHITLSRFLRDYLYIPLGGNRHGLWRRYRNLMIVMLLGGLWHGAGWTFIVWGGLHGTFLVINYGWRVLRDRLGMNKSYGRLGHAAAVLTTFLAVNISFVFFRADSLAHALLIVQAMAGFGGEFQGVASVGGADLAAMGPAEMLLWRFTAKGGLLVIVGLAAVWALPNTAQLIERLAGDMETRTEAVRRAISRPLLRWDRPAMLAVGGRFVPGSCIGILLALAALRIASSAPTEFLYFTF
jgi:alginate O-acetyltransferase complex protein AlgI